MARVCPYEMPGGLLPHDGALNPSLGVNFTPKLANAAGTTAAQLSSWADPTSIQVPAGVDFSPDHVLQPTGRTVERSRDQRAADR